jgi:hypothetical protein
VIIPDGSGGETTLDLSLYTNDHDVICQGAAPGPDAVFLADASNVELVFKVTNIGTETFSFWVLFTYSCDSGAVCDASFLVTATPGTPWTFNPTISGPMYVILEGNTPVPSTMPIRANYSLGAATPTTLATWGTVKAMYEE